ARFTPLNNKSLAVLLGGDIAVNRSVTAGVPFSPGYQIIGQVSYTFGLHTTERKHYYTTKDVNIVDRKFVIRKRINFKVGKAIIEPSSYGLLDEIAQVIQQNQVKKLLIAGHTDSTHSEEYNLKLSNDRANAVKTYLISKGVSGDILSTQGFGKRKPIASNATEAGRQENRRVEFFILE
ncbi:MAG: OmpA family protein, partial [Deltaproteobacteria bacterium]